MLLFLSHSLSSIIPRFYCKSMYISYKHPSLLLFIYRKNNNDKENENPVPKYKRDLVHKLKILKQEFTSLQPQGGHCRLEVSREEIFEVRSILFLA